MSIIPEDSWFCDPCASGLGKRSAVPIESNASWIDVARWFTDVRETKCVVCPNTGGALKSCADIPTTGDSSVQLNEQQLIQRGWCHVACCLWIPELRFFDVIKLSPVVGVNDIDADRLKLKCCVCKYAL